MVSKMIGWSGLYVWKMTVLSDPLLPALPATCVNNWYALSLALKSGNLKRLSALRTATKPILSKSIPFVIICVPINIWMRLSSKSYSIFSNCILVLQYLNRFCLPVHHENGAWWLPLYAQFQTLVLSILMYHMQGQSFGIFDLKLQ